MTTAWRDINQSPLGHSVSYVDQYSPDLLYPIPRAAKRREIEVPADLPFRGADLWTAYELSWLGPRGKPCVAMADIVVPCTSPNLIESKSLKLYLNSLNGTTLADWSIATDLIRRDLSQATGAPVSVALRAVDAAQVTYPLQGTCLDELDIACDVYTPHPELLMARAGRVTSTVYSNLLKSNCLVTGQPDWGSVQICYTGRPIDHAGLLRYIVSFRNHNEFHEQCIERMFMDIMNRCTPEMLSVYARYTRRGGLDINPYRSTRFDLPLRLRTPRQ